MSGLILNLKRDFSQKLSVLAVTGLSQFIGLERTQISKCCVFRIKNQSFTNTHEAVRNNRHRAKVRHVHVSSANDGRRSVRRSHVTLSSDTSKGRDFLLARCTNHQDLRRATRLEHFSHNGTQQSFSEGTLSAIGTGRNTNRCRISTARTEVRVGLDPRQQRTHLTSDGRRTSRTTLVSQQDGFQITLQFSRSLSQLVSLFRLTTSLVHCVQSARNLNSLLDDLGIVAQTNRRGQGCRSSVSTFNSSVSSGCSSQRVSLPLVVNSGCFGLANRRHERSLGRRDVIDDVGQVFTLTNSGMCGICRHVNAP